jgi:cytochrome P450
MTGADLIASDGARTPPETGVLDLGRLGLTMMGEVMRHGRGASMRRALRGWTDKTSAKYGSPNFILRAGPKRVMMVGGAELSHCILARKPGDGLVTGDMKRKGMALLAPMALTISDGAEWERRRAFNERVLQPGRTHSLAAAFEPRIRDAFHMAPITDVTSIREAMRRAMLSIVFGMGKAPDALSHDVDTLFGFVQSPVKRMLLGFTQSGRRNRVHATLGQLWTSTEESATPCLLSLARTGTLELSNDEVLDQIPHWMFTFTGSGTDLLATSLALVLSDPDAKRELVADLAAAGNDAAAIDAQPYPTSCLGDAGHLFPPVARTFHHATADLDLAHTHIPNGMELMHSFPLTEHAPQNSKKFCPQRQPATDTFDPFLGGARNCPGRNLITFVCKVALSELILTQRIELAGPPLRVDALPSELSNSQLRFRSIDSTRGAA